MVQMYTRVPPYGLLTDALATPPKREPAWVHAMRNDRSSRFRASQMQAARLAGHQRRQSQAAQGLYQPQTGLSQRNDTTLTDLAMIGALSTPATDTASSYDSGSGSSYDGGGGSSGGGGASGNW